MSDSNDLISNQNLQWNINIELMLSKWCDQAKCYEWMHIESWNSYNKKAKQLMIILTVLGSFSGLTNVIAGNYNVNGFQMSWVFGSIGILVGMLNVLQDKLSYQTLANDFKQYSIQWGVERRRCRHSWRSPCPAYLCARLKMPPPRRSPPWLPPKRRTDSCRICCACWPTPRLRWKPISRSLASMPDPA